MIVKKKLFDKLKFESFPGIGLFVMSKFVEQHVCLNIRNLQHMWMYTVHGVYK